MAPQATETRSVLVVTDDADLGDEMTYGFPQDVDVRVVPDVAGAVAQMQSGSPDVVVMSIRNGNAGGFSLALEMNQRVATQGTPIILLLERSQDAWLAGQAGAAAVLTAPFSSAQIVDVVLGQLGVSSPAL
jgi:DNA-binding response OmpR family regulator